MSKYKLLLLLLSILFTGNLIAQDIDQDTDTVYVFRFVTHKDMFYVPWKGNETSLDSLRTLVDTHKPSIQSGKVHLLIDGYCASEPTKAENLKLAKIRSNRVKSELILNKGMKESYFITHNHPKPYGIFKQMVIVRLRLPRPTKTDITPTTEITSVTEAPIVATTKSSKTSEKQTTEVSTTTSLTAIDPDHSYSFALRTNLLRWVTLTPNLGIEWRINRHWGILANSSWTSLSWNAKEKRYSLWEISPEVRYYLGQKNRGFLGIKYQQGDFHYKFETIGRQGGLQGGGLTGGYLFDLKNNFSLDFHAGAGFTYADYNEYTVINDVRVRKNSKNKNYWGINQLGITLIWKIVK